MTAKGFFALPALLADGAQQVAQSTRAPMLLVLPAPQARTPFRARARHLRALPALLADTASQVVQSTRAPMLIVIPVQRVDLLTPLGFLFVPKFLQASMLI